MEIIDAKHPFFRPLWRRVIIVVLCLSWGAFEFSGGNPAWSILFVALGLYSGYKFFVNFPPPEEEDDE